MKTILIVDVQNGFIKEETKDIPQRIKEHLNTNGYDHVLFSQFINTKGSVFETFLNWKKLYTSPETDIVPELLEYVHKTKVFKKSTYSALKSTALARFIRTNRVTELDICGLESDGCVLASAYEAFDLGIRVTMLHDLMRSSAPLNQAVEEIVKRNIDRKVTEH